MDINFFMIATSIVNAMAWAYPSLRRPHINVVAASMNDWEVYFIVLNAINWMAKLTAYEDWYVSQDWYRLKSMMLHHALSCEECIHGLWYREGIVYYEGVEYQVSFHLFEVEDIDDWEESDYLREGDEYQWTQVPAQEVGLEILSDLFVESELEYGTTT